MPKILTKFVWIPTWSNNTVSTSSYAWNLVGIGETNSLSSVQNKADRVWTTLPNPSRTDASNVTSVSQRGMTTNNTI